MKYWMFQNNQVKGPYDPDDLSQVPGFSAESLVCSEGRKGTNMGDWQRASMVPELSVPLLRASQLVASGKGPSSGFFPGLPPEPTLRDLAQLGSLQEKVTFLDGTITQLQDNLRLKENDLLCVHRELEEKNRQAGELALKLATLEERLAAINALQTSLEKTTSAERELEALTARQGQTISELTGQIQILQSESASLKAESEQLKSDSAQLKTDSAELKAKEGEIAELRAQIEELKARPASPAPFAAPEKAEPLPTPIAFSPKPETSPMLAGLTPLSPEGLQPAAGEKLTQLIEPKPEVQPPAGPGDGPSPAPFSAPPSSGLGAPAPSGPMPFSPLSASVPGGRDAPPPPAPPPAGVPAPEAPPSVAPPVTAAPPKKGGLPKPVLAAVVIIALGGAFAAKEGLLGGKKSAPVPEQAPVAPPPPPIVETPKKPTPEEIAEQKKKDAVELVRAFPVPGGAQTLGQMLEGQAPPQTGLSSWMAEPIKDDLFQVNFFPKPGAPTNLEFQADLSAKTVTAHNEPAAAILTPKEKKIKKPKIKAKAPKGAAKKAASGDEAILQDLLGVPSDEGPSAPAGGEEAAAPAKPAAKKGKAKPRNVSKEVDDILNDGGSSAPARPAPAAKNESLDDLLSAPGEGGGGAPGEPAANPAPADENPPPAAKKKSAKSVSKSKPADAELLDDLLKP